jgi:hypothetical protein
MDRIVERSWIERIVEDCGSRVYRPLIALIGDAGDDPCEYSGLITLRL